ncbi:DUF5316 family protein [Fictibacillus sp. Mic-4]|uniref:DUF5316 family protein n=1 Tax=Fictibacillus sp. Mic-4 TaxID=3132826 RepID=UPI003CF26162
MKSFGLGICIVLTALIVSHLFYTVELFIKLTSSLSILCSRFSLGYFVSSDRRRLNFYVDPNSRKYRRLKWSFRFLMLGLPCLIGAVGAVIFLNMM